MSFLRPEARAQLWRWREVLVALPVAVLGLNWVFARGIMPWIGGLLLAVAAALVLAGLQRVRFRRGAGGAGVVQVVEGQISYFGPLSGGAVALSELSRVTLDPSGRPLHWQLTQPGQPRLDIPVNAEGAEALFDAFQHLPGLRTERMLRLLEMPPEAPVTIWQRTSAQIDVPRLH
ncbi:hypothetical protein [Mesobacterium pallidum]|uniref:hypothetical protein n=1 Tax=Mesobacterium pallidum TaxID=2872037 RepID=UPI001EE36D70